MGDHSGVEVAAVVKNTVQYNLKSGKKLMRQKKSETIIVVNSTVIELLALSRYRYTLYVHYTPYNIHIVISSMFTGS